MSKDDPFETPEGIHEDEGGIKRDRWGRYVIPDPDSGVERPWTRATTFAKSISDPGGLQRWAERMVAKGITMRPDLFALASATDLGDRQTLDDVAEQAKTTAGSRTAAHYGTALHAFVESTNKGDADAEIPEPWAARVRAYTKALAAHQIEIVPDMVERVVIVKQFGVAGTFDAIARMPGAGRPLWIADLKTGRSLDYAWQEISVQLALYAHADAIYDYRTGQFEPMPPVVRDKGLIIHLPIEGNACDLYEVNLELGWRAAELCNKVRNWRKFKGLATHIGSASVDGPGPALSWAERIEAAESVEELTDIWLAARAAGEWSDVLQQLGMKRKAEIERAA